MDASERGQPLESIGPRLRRVRRAQDITQDALAERTGVAVSTIVRIEKGQVTPQIETVFKIAEALGIDPKALAFGDDQEEGPRP